MDRVTFATSSGLIWVSLAFHFAAGLVGIVAGAVALVATKGGRLHTRGGLVFSGAMLLLGLSASGIGAYEGDGGQVVAGFVATYLVLSGTLAVRAPSRFGRGVEMALMVLAFVAAVTMLTAGVSEAMDPTVRVVGRPRAIPPLVAGTLILLAATGDLRALRAGGLRGSRRLARHLWRMSLGLFVATGSFFLGQMNFIPEPVRIVPVLFVLALAPLPFLFYWLWRVSLRGRVDGLILGTRPTR